MAKITHRYTLDQFNSCDAEEHYINIEIINVINNLAKLVGAPEYRKTPVFKKNDRHKQNDRIKPVELDWEAIRNFKVTNVVKNDDGINEHIGTIRVLLNKMTKNNYDTTSKEMLELLKQIVENSETTESDLTEIGKSIFETSTNNHFWSNLYSRLYKDILDIYPIYNTICENNLTEFMVLFNNIRYVNAEKDYDMFCVINKENEKRRALGNFFVNLMNRDIIDVDKIGEIILNLIHKFKTTMDTKNCNEIVDETGENIIIMTKGGNEKLSKEFKNYDKIREFISFMTEVDYNEHDSISSKISFKFMDFDEELV